MKRYEAKEIVVEVWKDGSRNKAIHCGNDRRQALTLYGSLTRLSVGAYAVLLVDGRELHTADALRFLKTSVLPGVSG